MKAIEFFKTLNAKINKYDKAATNPFIKPANPKITLIWIEDEKDSAKP